MIRRRFIRLAGVSWIAIVSGCLGTEPMSAGNSASPTTTDSTDDSCQSDLERIDLGWSATSGPLDGFDLSLSAESVSTGETLVAKLKNVTEEQQDSGNRAKFDIQLRTDDGWQSIFWTDPYVAWTDEAISHPPGEGFNWEFEMTRNGLTTSRQNGPDYYVCRPLDSGRYRFVYWGLTNREDENTDTDTALGARFEVTRDE